MHLTVRVALALLLFVLLPSVAQAEKRIAFVVGIDKYDNLGPQQQLQRAVNDARAINAELASLGFEVIGAENPTRGTFNAQWQKFLDKINPEDTAAIYFSGHGAEIEGLNFLLPRDLPNISYGRQEQLKRESISVAEMLLDLRKRKPQVTLMILDACRDHPLVPAEQRSLSFGRGLARMDAPNGTFIMYSAGAGETALDRLPKDDPDKANSVYTRKLLPLMKTPGLALHDLARQLRREVHDVAAAVPHTQQPAYYDGLIGQFCLAGCEVTHTSLPAGTFVLKGGMVVPRDLPPAVQQCIAAQGDRKPWEYDWAKCGVVTPKDIANLPPPRPAVPVAPNVKHFVCGTTALRLELVESPLGTVSEIRLPADYGTRRYRVTKATSWLYDGEEIDAAAPDAVGTVSLDVTGVLTLTNRISFDAVGILVKACDGQISQNSCSSAMEKIKGGNPFACLHTDIKQCGYWRSNSNVLSVFREHCSPR